MATSEATWAYRDRHTDGFGRTYFRRFGDCIVSSIGFGTYLDDPTDAVDESYHDSIVRALDSGINVVDTAINYRHQRSERVVGRALDAADIDRDAVVITTKGGFVPFDGERPDDPGEYIREEYVEPGIVDPDDLVRGMHSLVPAFVDDQLDRSLSNLGIETIDCYYVHNPEFQLDERSRESVYDDLEATFVRLEERAATGDLRHYGVATWDAFRVTPDDPNHLSLPEVVSRARAAARTAGNDATHFRAVQLPFNVVMADAFTVAAHDGPDGPQSALRFAREAGLDVFVSAPLAQGRLADEIPTDVAERLDGETPAAKALTFARSGPGVTCALVGMRRSEHVVANVDSGRADAMGADAFDATFE
ncbi:aldo/keto reductase [Halococcus saccharolyticus]|uniref:Aldo/keto reductase n=1 Tax=Halococcus saccharolyticus DSM 5350 TaxID=1227455 RepID=M0MGM5_9EURY|nr:aldo/keto reductase [Halococcus saccharolyticus]EMA44887.1 aldo/keto reductase [Halococcus saccharolyticus DSM 5350]